MRKVTQNAQFILKGLNRSALDREPESVNVHSMATLPNKGAVIYYREGEVGKLGWGVVFFCHQKRGVVLFSAAQRATLHGIFLEFCLWDNLQTPHCPLPLLLCPSGLTQLLFKCWSHQPQSLEAGWRGAAIFCASSEGDCMRVQISQTPLPVINDRSLLMEEKL